MEKKEVKEIVKQLWLGRPSDLQFQQEVEKQLLDFRERVVFFILKEVGEASEVEVLEPDGVETEYGKGFSDGCREGWNAVCKKIVTIFNSANEPFMNKEVNKQEEWDGFVQIEELKADGEYLWIKIKPPANEEELRVIVPAYIKDLRSKDRDTLINKYENCPQCTGLRDEALEKCRDTLIERIELKLPTRETKVTIETGGKDPHNTTPESLVAMGYRQALEDVKQIILEVYKPVPDDK